MTSLILGSIHTGAIPADENTVRNTATPVYDGDRPAEQEDAPDFNEIRTDSNPHLGMVNRQLNSHVIPMQKSVPPWLDEVNHNADANDIVNRQVSTSGTAAAREASGQWGHGTILITEGIEPVQGLVDGGRFDNAYFAANDPLIQSSSGNYMSTAPGQDYTVPGLVSATGKVNARAATEASTYAAFYNAITGG